MSSFPGSPKLIKGGLVILDAASGAVSRKIALQYNPDALSRSYQVRGADGDGATERTQPFRLKGRAIASIKLEVETDATNSLKHPDQDVNAVAFGIAPQLAALNIEMGLTRLGQSMHQTTANMTTTDEMFINISKNNRLHVAQHGAEMDMKRVIVHVDHLALKGFRPEDRHAIAAGLQRELGRVFADREAMSHLKAEGDAARLRVGRLPVGHGAKPQRVGEQVALGIGQEIGK